MSSDTQEKSSTDPTTSAGHDPRPTPRRLRFPRFGLSATQLAATALAAITATFAASYFGVAGTVLGAALVSVMTAAGKEVYSQSIRSTGQRVLAAVPVTRSLPVATPSDPAELPPTLPAREAPRISPAAESAKWRRLALGTMAVFVTVLTVITGVEIVAGRPVSDIVRGESGQGTSLFGAQQVRTRTVPATVPSTPTVTVTVTPKVVVTTPTLTRTATPRTATTTPTSSPATSASQSASPSSGSTTATGSKSAASTAAP